MNTDESEFFTQFILEIKNSPSKGYIGILAFLNYPASSTCSPLNVIRVDDELYPVYQRRFSVYHFFIMKTSTNIYYKK